VSDYYDEDGEVIVRSAKEWRTSRRARKCHACKEPIAVGARYHRTAYLFGGSWEVTARCERCQAIYEYLDAKIRFQPNGPDLEHCNERLNCGHEYRERWGEDPPPEIAALAFWLPGDPLPQHQKPGAGPSEEDK
jgi:hypothetical protein